jgi:hypothetical protein
MSSDMTPPDCLVLKIEEYDDQSELNITNIFVLYDQKMEKYVLRGSGVSKKAHFFAPFSFMADSATDLADFILFALDRQNKLNLIMYNYDNLHETSDEITYEFLARYESNEYEIAGYNNAKPTHKYLVKCLRMLRNVYNPM